MFKLIIYFFQSILIYTFFIIGKILGLKLSRKFFALIFLIIGPIFKSKKIINNNLEIFSKFKLDIDKEKITNEMWKSYGMTFIEYMYLNNLRKNKSHIKIEGEKYLTEINRIEKPVIFVSGHFSNFELMSMEITKKNIKLATIYRPLNNIFLNPFMEFLRKKYICKNQIRKGMNGVRDAINFLKKNYSIALMIDQRVSEGEKLDFFGKPAFTTTLPAQLAIKFNLKIVPVFIQRFGDNNFKIKFHQPINSQDFKNKIDLSKKLNELLEKMIIENSNQWIWTHNRWK